MKRYKIICTTILLLAATLAASASSNVKTVFYYYLRADGTGSIQHDEFNIICHIGSYGCVQMTPIGPRQLFATSDGVDNLSDPLSPF